MAALPPDYFTLFDIPETLTVDEGELQRKFYDLSRKHHPDRFGSRPPAEQQYALDFTAMLNDAYRTLRDPLKRAEYVLRRSGFDIGEQRTKDVPPELLEEVFELNLMLEETPDKSELEEARTKFLDMQTEIDKHLTAEAAKYDWSGDRAYLSSIRGLLNRRRYVQNLVREVEKALA